jgi:hypothetical protein
MACHQAALGTNPGAHGFERECIMDSTAFDGLTRAVAGATSRRRVLGTLGALTLGGTELAVLGQAPAEARRRRRKHHGKTPKQCTDGIRNGAETDVDCGGGRCPRCQGGQTCTNRNDCHTALCDGGTCQSCTAASDCGLDTDGSMCFCRDNAATPGERMCTRQTCTLVVGGRCAQCAAGEQCAPAGPGAIECCIPCGA